MKTPPSGFWLKYGIAARKTANCPLTLTAQHFREVVSSPRKNRRKHPPSHKIKERHTLSHSASDISYRSPNAAKRVQPWPPTLSRSTDHRKEETHRVPDDDINAPKRIHRIRDQALAIRHDPGILNNISPQISPASLSSPCKGPSRDGKTKKNSPLSKSPP